MGLSGFCRSFIKSYPSIARPLAILFRKDAPFTWGTEQQRSFETLKATLTSPPVLAYHNFKKPFYLYTDVSTIGLGAALMQYDERHKLQLLGYASRTLNAVESNYRSTHLEALAVVWALKHFRDLIHGYEIHARTDHAAVVELFNVKSLTGKLRAMGINGPGFSTDFCTRSGRRKQCSSQSVPLYRSSHRRNRAFANRYRRGS